MQGLLANAIDLAFNEKFGQTLPILSDEQIVHNVGLTPAGSTSFYNVQPYVLVPEPSTFVLLAVGLIGLLPCRRHARSAGCETGTRGLPRRPRHDKLRVSPYVLWEVP